MGSEWLYRLKRKIIVGLTLLLGLCMSGAMFVIILMMRDSLLNESARNTGQVGNAITSSLKNHMLRREPDLIQNTLKEIASGGLIDRIFIIDNQGKVAYSSDEKEVGRRFDRQTEESCRVCHRTAGVIPSSTTLIVKTAKGDVHRNVTVIRNSHDCFGCHSPSDRINGKLIIDRPLAHTYRLIGTITLVILLSGAAALLIAIPFLSRRIDRYIRQIILKNNEISLVYSIIDNISKTIDVEELKQIVLDIVRDALSADEVSIVLPRKDGCRVVRRAAESDAIERRKLEPGEPLAAVVARWLEGKLSAPEVSPDRTLVYLPIVKGDYRLALITVHCNHNPFPAEKLALVEAISNHIAIAFENARLYSIAITDELSGLFTVRHFRTCIDRQFTSFERYAERFVLLMIDIDNFKRVNDTYGHVAGDAVLKQVAHSIADSVRNSDLAFRYGGEEFAVILPATAAAGGLHVAERIRRQVEETEIVVDGIPLLATVSIGLAICPENAVTAREIIIEADNALYAAKHQGKNRVVPSTRTDAAAKPPEPTVVTTS